MDFKSSPLISVLLPVYNVETFLGDAIRSILSQTVTNFELLLLDDCSTDRTVQIASSFAKSDARIKIVSFTQKRGLVALLNEGIRLSKGDFIARMDGDDVALPTRFEEQLKQLKLTGADICGTWIECFGALKTVAKFPSTHTQCLIQSLFGVPLAHPAAMVRREVYEQISYSSFYERAEDYELWYRCFVAGFRFTNVPKVLLRYRMHTNQVSQKYSTEQSVKAAEIRLKFWQLVLPKEDKSLLENAVKIISECQGDTKSFVHLATKLLYEFGDAEELLMERSFVTLLKSCKSSSGAHHSWWRLVCVSGLTWQGACRYLILLTSCMLSKILFHPFFYERLYKLWHRLKKIKIFCRNYLFKNGVV